MRDLDEKLNIWQDELLDKIIKFDEQITYLQDIQIVEILHPIEDIEFMELNKNISLSSKDYFSQVFDYELQKSIKENRGNWFPLSIVDKRRSFDSLDDEYFGFEAAKLSIAKILMDFSLYIGAKKQLTPITDNGPIINLFFSNLQDWHNRSTSTNNSPNLQSLEMVKFLNPYDNIIPHRTVQLYLPNVKDLSFEDIVYLREKYNSELQHFRDELSKITIDIKNTEVDKNFFREIENTIIEKVNPSIRELERGLSLIKDKHIYQTFKKILSVGSVISVAGFAFPGIPLPFALMLNWSVSCVTGWLDYKYEKRALLEKNGFSFLLTTAVKIKNRPQRGRFW